MADLTPEGPARVRGYAGVQTVSGVLGICAYLISIFLGNHVQVLVTVAVVFFLTLVPLFFIAETTPAPAAGATVLADGPYHLAAGSVASTTPASAADTAGRILSMGLLLLKLSDALGRHRRVYAQFSLCLAVSFGFWCRVPEREPARAGPAGP